MNENIETLQLARSGDVRDAPWVLLVARARHESQGLSACGERNKCEMTTVAKTAMGGGSREGRARVSKSIAAGSGTQKTRIKTAPTKEPEE